MKKAPTDYEIRYLNYLIRSYDGLNKLMVQVQNRKHAMLPEVPMENLQILHGYRSSEGNYQGLIALKYKISQEIKAALPAWDIWTYWLEKVPGIGPYIAGKHIVMHYYRFTAVCPECGGDLEKQDGAFVCLGCGKNVKGEGNLQFRIDFRTWPTAASWWHYMGVHNAPHCRTCGKRVSKQNGLWMCPQCKLPEADPIFKKPKKQKNMQADWSSQGRALCFQVSESFVKQNIGHLYRAYYDKRKAIRERTHPEASKGHRNNMAKNEMSKLFESHFWMVARELSGLPVPLPKICEIDPAHTLITPYYWDGIPE
jgi:Zn finger protein HypA/HybF involved in hydrogenase expression